MEFWSQGRSQVSRLGTRRIQRVDLVGLRLSGRLKINISAPHRPVLVSASPATSPNDLRVFDDIDRRQPLNCSRSTSPPNKQPHLNPSAWANQAPLEAGGEPQSSSRCLSRDKVHPSLKGAQLADSTTTSQDPPLTAHPPRHSQQRPSPRPAYPQVSPGPPPQSRYLSCALRRQRRGL